MLRRRRASPWRSEQAPGRRHQDDTGAGGPALYTRLVPSSELLLHDLFGFPAFRPGQQLAVDAALNGRDALVVMPTGAGKSLCYAIPGLATEELTIVVSPLQALMRDQVEALRARGHERGVPARLVARPARGLGDARGRRRRVVPAPVRRPRALRRRPLPRGGRRVAPSTSSRSTRPTACPTGVTTSVPTTCASRMRATRSSARCTMALTATATRRVAADIARAMRLRDPVEVATGFDRPNLTFDVIPARTEAAKWRLLRSGLAEETGRPALVYAGTRRRCEELAGQLRAEGLNAAAYHAGLPDSERAAVQTGFMEGDPEIVVATTAFGMGVDKADVRAVWHWALPDSLEAYYQEAGRAGRDGEPARCVLLYSPSDRGLIGRRIAERAVDAGDVNELLARLASLAAEDGTFAVSLDDLGERGKTLLAVAERIGALELWPGRGGKAAGRLRLRAIGRNRSAEVEAASRAALRDPLGGARGDHGLRDGGPLPPPRAAPPLRRSCGAASDRPLLRRPRGAGRPRSHASPRRGRAARAGSRGRGARIAAGWPLRSRRDPPRQLSCAPVAPGPPAARQGI